MVGGKRDGVAKRTVSLKNTRAKPATGQRHRPRCRQRRRQSVASRHHPAPSFIPHRACTRTNRWWSGVVKVCIACSEIMRTVHMSRFTCSIQRRETRTRILPWGDGTHSRKKRQFAGQGCGRARMNRHAWLRPTLGGERNHTLVTWCGVCIGTRLGAVLVLTWGVWVQGNDTWMCVAWCGCVDEVSGAIY